jgi:hypothetical protein
LVLSVSRKKEKKTKECYCPILAFCGSDIDPAAGAIPARSLLQRTGSTAAIFSPPIFLPSIFLPFPFSPSFVSFGDHRKITRRPFRLAEKRKRKQKNVTALFLPFAVPILTQRRARSRRDRFSNAPADPRLTFHRLIFLPSIFLPFPLSPLFVFSAITEILCVPDWHGAGFQPLFTSPGALYLGRCPRLV